MREIDDMGITPVENSFLNHYMSKARGDYVKVYLYGLKCCFQGSSEFPSNSEIADFLMIEEDDVMKAWKYWEKQGLSLINIQMCIRDSLVAVDNIMGKNTEMDLRAVPSCVYTDPEIAVVGKT